MAEKVKVNYIYADAEEKYVKAVVLYFGGEGNILYYDEACEHAVNGADVLNFFLKGLILSDGTYYYNTLEYSDNGSLVTIKFNEGSATAPIVTE